LKTNLEGENDCLSTFLESSLNFLPHNQKKNLENLVQSSRKGVSKFELPETQFEARFEGTISDKIACKTHLN